MSTENLVDIWRKRNVNKRNYTWRENNPKVKCRLDFFLIPEASANDVIYCDNIPSICSDHDIIDIKLKLQKHARGRGLWKLNNSLLENKNYMNGIKDIINRWDFDTSEDLTMKFDLLKYGIMRENTQKIRQGKLEKPKLVQ